MAQDIISPPEVRLLWRLIDNKLFIGNYVWYIGSIISEFGDIVK